MLQRASPQVSDQGLAETGASAFRFSGYASLFNLPDLSGDKVLMGAFHRSLRARGAAGIRMLWNHDPAEPIGVWTSINEDPYGLRVEGRLTCNVARSAGLAALISDGALDGLSIGFHTIRSDRPRGTKGRRLIEVDLWEISLVAFPMQPGARVDRIVPAATNNPSAETFPPPATQLATSHPTMSA
ncbi:MAG: HK97 family phage prohead protease [Devosiaceae bacterium]